MRLMSRRRCYKEKTDIANEQKRLLEEKDREIARLKEQLERIKHPV